MDMQKAPVYKRLLYRPWIFPFKLLGKFTHPVPGGLWIVNMFFQKILAINGEIPWMVHFTSRVLGNITIGRNVWISFAVSGGCYIQGGNGIEIGADTIFAPGIKIISANHNFEDHSKWEPALPVKIGQKCWLGANVVILPGVEIGDNVVIAAGAVVTKNLPSYSIAAGIPAKIIRKLDIPKENTPSTEKI